MRASEYRELAEALRADGLTTGQIVERWVGERGLNPREAARLSHGWTQQQAADEWNALWPDPEHPCTRKHVSNWETTRQPNLDTLNRLARVYRCAAGELLGGEDYSHLDGRRARPGAAMLSVAVTVVVHDGAVLLVRARGGGWQFPSGVVKSHEAAAERAVEETAAETGVRCRVTAELGGRVHPVSSAWCDYFRADYLAGQLVNGQPAGPGRSTPVGWVEGSRPYRRPTRPTREITPPPARSGYARATDGRTAEPYEAGTPRVPGGKACLAPHEVNDAGLATLVGGCPYVVVKRRLAGWMPGRGSCCGAWRPSSLVRRPVRPTSPVRIFRLRKDLDGFGMP